MPDNNPFASYKPLTVSGEYVSPWDIADINNIDVGYHFDSNSVNFSWYDWINSVYVQGLYVRVTPYLGLAYYDGANDGNYFFHNNRLRYNDASKEVVVNFEDFKDQASVNSNYKLSNEEFTLNTDGSKRKIITYGDPSGIHMFLY